MLQQCSMVATLWNAMLAIEEARYASVRGQKGVTHKEEEKAFLSYFDIGYQITDLRRDCPEWEALSVHTPFRVAKALTLAFEGFFRRAKQGAGVQSGYPKYKSYFKGQHNWLPHRFASGCKMDQLNKRSWHLKLKGVSGPMLCKGKFPIDPEKYTDADIRYRSGAWWLSVGVAMEPRREPGRDDLVVKLDCLDKFAEVNGKSFYRFDVGLNSNHAEQIATIQKAMSALSRQSEEYKDLRQQKARIEARAARKRNNALHVWTTMLTECAKSITVIAPENVKEVTKSGKGNEKDWGAAVDVKAEINRHILEQAPSTVVQMLEYKCAEARIAFEKQSHDKLKVGNLVVANRKAARKVSQALRQAG